MLWLMILFVLVLTLVILGGVWLVFYRLRLHRSLRHHEDFVDSSKEPLDDLTFHVTTLDDRSYPKHGGRVWFNIIKGKELAGLFLSIEPKNLDQWNRLDGFMMSDNTIEGPMCNTLGIALDQAFSIGLIIKIDEPPPKMASSSSSSTNVVILHMFANTSSNNGLKLEMSAENRLKLTVGALPSWSTSQRVSFINGRHYGIFVVRDAHGLIKVLSFDLTEHKEPAKVLIQGQASLSKTETFANRNLMINEKSNWSSARLLEFRVYNQVINEDDIHAMRTLIITEINRNNPLFRRQERLSHELSAMRKCPFDSETCRKCGRFKDWSGIGIDDVVLSNDTTCGYAISDFCKDHPFHDRCRCWDVSQPQYHKRCQHIRQSIERHSQTIPSRPSKTTPPRPSSGQFHDRHCYENDDSDDYSSDAESDLDEL